MIKTMVIRLESQEEVEQIKNYCDSVDCAECDYCYECCELEATWVWGTTIRERPYQL